MLCGVRRATFVEKGQSLLGWRDGPLLSFQDGVVLVGVEGSCEGHVGGRKRSLFSSDVVVVCVGIVARMRGGLGKKVDKEGSTPPCRILCHLLLGVRKNNKIRRAYLICSPSRRYLGGCASKTKQVM